MVELIKGKSSDKYNLNAISHDTAIELIRQVQAQGIKLTKVERVCGCCEKND